MKKIKNFGVDLLVAYSCALAILVIDRTPIRRSIRNWGSVANRIY